MMNLNIQHRNENNSVSLRRAGEVTAWAVAFAAVGTAILIGMDIWRKRKTFNRFKNSPPATQGEEWTAKIVSENPSCASVEVSDLILDSPSPSSEAQQVLVENIKEASENGATTEELIATLETSLRSMGYDFPETTGQEEPSSLSTSGKVPMKGHKESIRRFRSEVEGYQGSKQKRAQKGSNRSQTKLSAALQRQLDKVDA